jgi:hypothetical protein
MRGISAVIATNPVMPVQAGVVVLRPATTGRGGMGWFRRARRRGCCRTFFSPFSSVVRHHFSRWRASVYSVIDYHLSIYIIDFVYEKLES